MGLDVHDMENLGEVWVGYNGQPKSTQFGRKSQRLAIPLEPGFVHTVEPGIYFIPELIEMWKVEACGMKSSVTFISGLAGREGWEDHAIQTGTMISEMEPSYVGLLTLIVEPNVPMAKEIEDGTFTPLTPEEVEALR